MGKQSLSQICVVELHLQQVGQQSEVQIVELKDGHPLV